MSVRDWMNSNGTTVTLGAIVLLIVALVILGFQLFNEPSVPTSARAYYYDTETGTVFVNETIGLLPPIETPSGSRTGMRAHIYACGACPSASDLEGRTAQQVEQAGAFIAWIEQFDERARAASQQALDDPIQQEQMMEARRRGHFVKRIDDEQWAHQMEAVTQFRSQLSARCDGEAPALCRPGS